LRERRRGGREKGNKGKEEKEEEEVEIKEGEKWRVCDLGNGQKVREA
jgi:hypothetical protein